MTTESTTNPYEPPKSSMARPKFKYPVYAAILAIVMTFGAAAVFMWVSYRREAPLSQTDSDSGRNFLYRGPAAPEAP
jgi:hypothetical protein